MKFQQLRQRYPNFIYRDYSINYRHQELTLSAHFVINPGIEFHPQVSIRGIPLAIMKSIPSSAISNLAFHLGLAEIPSYWKATCSPHIKIEAGNLNSSQLRWWKNFLISGLGEFFFTNKIRFSSPNFLTFQSDRKRPAYQPHSIRTKKSRVLVPIGGGKDSVVTLEILKRHFSVTLFVLDSTAATDRIIRKNPSLPIIHARRNIDARLLQLNSQGYLNGHTPFNGYLAFLLTLVAALWGIPYIAVSNEASANQGNTTFLGKIINHQFSKSFTFERMFQNYSTKYLFKNIEYFSFLRPLSELQIAKIFSRYPDFYLDIRSCNAGQRQDKWCGQCSKCLFVYSVMNSFIPSPVIRSIFGSDLFNNRSLLPIAKQLWGGGTHKPFECVGTYSESLAAWYLSLKKIKQEETKTPYLMGYFSRKIIPKHKNIDRLSNSELHKWNIVHKLPTKFKNILYDSTT
jgi:UDP-N-acetyl-alpha-D-muramoyl-L-alanyl-L-glutamate epimerase